MSSGAVGPTNRRPRHINSERVAQRVIAHRHPIGLLPLARSKHVQKRAASCIFAVRTGKLRPLAVTTATRSDAVPEIPTVGDFVPGYEESSFFGVGAPRNTPEEIIDRLNAEINLALADPKMKARLTNLGSIGLIGRPADFGRLIAEETEKWAKVVKFAGIKAD